MVGCEAGLSLDRRSLLRLGAAGVAGLAVGAAGCRTLSLAPATRGRVVGSGATALAFASTGESYELRAGSDSVLCREPDGAIRWEIGSRGSEAGRFDQPASLDLDGSGRVHVLDSGNHRIQVLHPSGLVLFAFGSRGAGPGELLRPQGALRVVDGRVHVCDGRNRRIQVYDANGRFEASLTDPTLGFPQAVAGAGDALWVADAATGRILAFENGSPSLVVERDPGGEPFVFPRSLLLDSHGSLWVADSGARRVSCFPKSSEPRVFETRDTEGAPVVPLEVAAAPDGSLWFPTQPVLGR